MSRARAAAPSAPKAGAETANPALLLVEVLPEPVEFPDDPDDDELELEP